MPLRIGIDLGTTNCCIAVRREVSDPKGNVSTLTEVITDGNNAMIPSVVSFRNNNIIFGDQARRRMDSDPASTIFEVKRFIGRKFSDPEIQENLKSSVPGHPPRWPFRVESDGPPLHNPSIKVQYQGRQRTFSPEQVSGFLLKYLKEIAERRLGDTVDTVAVTCPAYFNDGQRQATKDAAELAGFRSVRILNEPTAAVLALKEKDPSSIGKRVLVFDFGGGTLDVSICDVSSKEVTVVATGGDCYLGGADIDRKLVDLAVKKFKVENRCFNQPIEPEKMAELRLAVEDAKIGLTTAMDVDVFVKQFTNNHLEIIITRDEMLEECKELFAKAMGVVDSLLEAKRLTRVDIDIVLPVGGSSRIPRVRELLNQRFPGKVKEAVNPADAIAMGAACSFFHQLNDIIPLSLGTDLIGDRMSVIVPRFSRLPCSFSSSYITSKDNQRGMGIQILEGESPVASENHKLGFFELTGLTERPKGQTAAEITMSINSDGILEVTAVETSKNSNRRTICVEAIRGRLSTDEKQVQRTEINSLMAARRPATARR
ncbi:hypothetical protein RCL1_002806 [Eukaryota sp. TZLM3-RCL]